MADIKYTVDISFEEAINNAKKSGARIKNEIEGQLKQLRDTRIDILNKDETKDVQREIMVATDLIKKGKASAEELKAAYARGIRELKKQTKAVKGKNRALKVSLEEVKRAKKAQAEERKEIARKLRLLRNLKRGQKLYNQEIDRAVAAAKALKDNLSKAKVPSARGGGGLGALLSGKGATGIAALGNAFSLAAIKLRALTLGIELFQKGIQAVNKRASEMAQMSSALGSVYGSQQELNAVMAHAISTALEYGVAVTSIEAAWRRVGPASNAAGLSMRETGLLIEAASARIAQMGLNSEQSGRYMEALAQVMGKGKLQSEELNQQFSELDGALRAQLASFFENRKGVANFQDALARGEIKAKDFAEALVAVSQDAMTQMSQSTGKLVQDLEKLNFNQQNAQLGNLVRLFESDLFELFKDFGQKLRDSAAMIALWFATFNDRYPVFTTVMKAILGLVGNLAKLLTGSLLLALDMIIAPIEAVLASLRWLLENFPGLNGLFKHFADIGVRAGNIFDWIGDGAAQYVDVVSDAMSQQAEYNRIMEEGIAKNQESAEKQKEEAEATKKASLALADSIDKSITKMQLQEGIADASEYSAAAIGELTQQYMSESLALDDLIKKLEELAKARQKAQQKAIDDAYKAEKAAADEKIADIKAADKENQRAYEDEKQRIQDLKQANSDASKQKIDGINRYKESVKKAYDEIIKGIDRAIEAEKRRHDKAMAAINREKNQINARYDAANAALEAPTRSEQKLIDLKKEELRLKARDQSLSEKERLQAAAELERMEREAQIKANEINRARALAAAESKARAEEKRHEEEMQKLNDEKKRVQEEAKVRQDEISASADAEKQSAAKTNKYLDNKLKKLEKNRKKQKRTTEDAIEEQESRKKSAKNLKDSATAANTLSSNMENVKTAADAVAGFTSQIAADMERAVRSAQELARIKAEAARTRAAVREGLENAPLSTEMKNPLPLEFPNFASGGPIKGGTTATVNELGKEAFLSASGHLSMINTKSWGQWTAPTSGTIIPAHLTKLLDIPSGGVSINRQNANMASKAGGVGAMVKAIRQLNGGNHINNTVTVQSSNPTQTANSMMVNLQKIRRMRTRR